MEDKNLQYEDEIDLKELIKTLWEKKGFIILFTLLVSVVSVVYVLMAPRIYEPKAIVEIGYITKVDNTGVSKRELIDDSQRLIHELNIIFIDTLSKKEKKNKPIIKSIKISNKKNLQFVEITAQAKSNDLGVKKIEEVVSYIKNKHKVLVDENMEKLRLNITSIERDIDTIKNKTIKDLDDKILSIKKDSLVDLDDKIRILKTDTLKKLDDKIKILNTDTLKKLDDKIKILNTDTLKKLDDRIRILKTDTLKKLDDKIYLLKNDEIKKIQEKIKFINSVELTTLNTKIASLQDQIKKSEEELANLDKTVKDTATSDSSLTALNLIEKRSVQSRIDRDKMELLEIEKSKENLLNQVLPQLNRQEYDLSSIDLATLEREKDKLLTVELPNIEREREKLLTVDLPNLEREREKLLTVELTNLEIERNKLLTVDLPNLERERDKLINMDLQSLLREKKVLEEVKIPEMKNQIKKLELSMSKQNFKNSDLVGKIIVPDYPAKPKRILVVMVATVTGFILSIFIVFFINFVRELAAYIKTKN